MKIVAITGSIGCGKTTIAKIIRKQGEVVFDVDAWVRRLYFNKDFIKNIITIFPETLDNGVFNKRRLRNLVFSDNRQLKKLESLIHPFLKGYLKKVIGKNAQTDRCLFLDVALLFEMGWDRYCDFIVVADVDYEIQKQRVIKRDGVSAEDFDKINSVQISNEDKKKMADIVIDTDKTSNLLRLEVLNIVEYVCES